MNLLVNVTNLTADDVNFLRGIVSLFSDPQRAGQAEDFRSGRCSIRYVRTGTPLLPEPETSDLQFITQNSSLGTNNSPLP